MTQTYIHIPTYEGKSPPRQSNLYLLRAASSVCVRLWKSCNGRKRTERWKNASRSLHGLLCHQHRRESIITCGHVGRRRRWTEPKVLPAPVESGDRHPFNNSTVYGWNLPILFPVPSNNVGRYLTRKILLAKWNTNWQVTGRSGQQNGNWIIDECQPVFVQWVVGHETVNGTGSCEFFVL